MALISHFGNGTGKTFPLPGAASLNSVTVNGSPATVDSSDAFSVTLSAAPAKGTAVVIDFNPSSAVVRDAYTWGGKPAASLVPVGTIIRISDVGPAPGIRVWSDGTRWVPMGHQVLARSAIASAVTGTTAETVLATVPIPAAAMGIHGALIVASTWSYTNSANNKVLRTRLGGIAGTALMAVTNTTNVVYADQRRIRNRGATNSQACSFPAGSFSFGVSTSALSTSAIETLNAVDLVLTAQLGLASERAALETLEVLLTP